MKKLKIVVVFTTIIIAIMLLLQGCSSKTVYVDVNTGTKTDASSNVVTVKDFFDWETIIKDKNTRIVKDRNTDVLYYYEYEYGVNYESRAMTPIMEADGTPLTYTEWKAKRGK